MWQNMEPMMSLGEGENIGIAGFKYAAANASVTFDNLLGNPKKVVAFGVRKHSSGYFSLGRIQANIDHETTELLNGQDDIQIIISSESSARAWEKVSPTNFTINGNSVTLSLGASDAYFWSIVYTY